MGIIARPGIVDIIFLLFCLRVIYIAASRGFLREFLKIGGVICAGFFAFHFYPYLSESIIKKIGFINPNYWKPALFFLIFAGVSFFFFLLNLIAGLFLPKGEISHKKKLFLLGLGSFRALFFASLVFFFFYLASFEPAGIKKSFSYNFSRKVAPFAYKYFLETMAYLNKNFEFEVNPEVENYLQEDKPAQPEPVAI